ncbi:MAG: MerR family transcriptional regulator [Bacteroidetes bacterium]|nr:MerR family transcriptional regulator [Bacteroidota bacterium]MCY4233647.1 MerR family transcriptional regulator [Bacteroidota bacterium]
MSSTKLYYSIGEVSRIIGVETYVLRYWENEFPQLRPRRNSSGRRIYSVNDLDLARQIYDLLRVRKYTLDGARQSLQGNDQGPGKITTTHEQLLNLRSFLENIARQLE